MKRKIKVDARREQLVCDAGVAFATVDGWFGHVTRSLKMDIVYPETPRGAGEARRYPCVLWLCGGGWIDMDRSAHLAYLARLASRGFVAASAEYRLSNIAPYPASVKDVKAAIRYLKAHADRYNIEGARIGVMGESAGGYLAAMAALAASPDFDEGAHLEYPSTVQAACAWYPPADFSKMPLPPKDEAAASFESLLLGKNIALHPDAAAKASPVSFVTEDAPPFLLIHGNRDDFVPLACSESLYSKLVAAGCDAELIELEGAGHSDLAFFQDEVQDIIAAFFSNKLKGDAS